VLHVQSFQTEADLCVDGDKMRERLALSEQVSHRFHLERFSLKKLNEVEGKEQ
jgi:hypothetical protein